MTQDDHTPKKTKGLTRRAALARLGLGAAIAYSAPTVLHLDRSANATIRPTPCPGKGKGKGKGSKWCRRYKRPRRRGHHGWNRRGEGRGGRGTGRRNPHRRRRTPNRTRRPNRRGRG